MSDEFTPEAAPEAPLPEPAPEPAVFTTIAAGGAETLHPLPPAPDRFPISLEEYAATRRLDPMWPAGMAAFGGTGWRLLEEWDALLEAFKVKPVTNQ